jgi:hypothetical protein
MIVVYEMIDGERWAIVLDERGDEVARIGPPRPVPPPVRPNELPADSPYY